MRSILVFLTILFSGLALAQDKAIPVMIRADGDLDTCSMGKVATATEVRAGPGKAHRATGKLAAGASVWMFDERGDWIGIAYGVAEIECSPIKKTKAYDGPGKSGWVPKKSLRLLAG